MNIKDLFDLALPVVQVVETVGSAAGASGQQKRDQAIQLLAKRVNDRLELPEFVEKNTDEALGMVVDGAIWGLNSLLGHAWERETPMQEIAAQAPRSILEQVQIGMNRG